MSAEQTGAFFALVSVCSGLGSVLSLLLLLAKPVRERLFGLSAIREGQRCMLRADMLAAYYKHREEKTIRQYARQFVHRAHCPRGRRMGDRDIGTGTGKELWRYGTVFEAHR